MVSHLLETIALIKIDCGVLRIDDQANTTNLSGNTSRSVNGIKEHELPNAFPLMAYRGCQPPKAKNRNLVRQAFSVLRRQLRVHEFSKANRVEAEYFDACPDTYRDKGR